MCGSGDCRRVGVFSCLVGHDLCEAPWPVGMSAKWYDKEVYYKTQFVTSTAYPDLVDVRRFFWTAAALTPLL